MKLYNGKCEDILKQLPDQSIDAVITDPPYGKLAFNEWDKIIDYDVVCKELKRICKPKAAVILFSDYKEMFNLHKKITDNKLSYRYFLIWNKPNSTPDAMNSNRRPLNQTEEILVFSTSNNNVNYYTDGDAFERTLKFPYCTDFKESMKQGNMVYLDIKEVIRELRNGHAIDNATFVSRKGYTIIGSGYAKISAKGVLKRLNEFTIYDDYIERKCISHKNNPQTILTYNALMKSDRLHPTQKPIDLMKKLVSLYTKEGDTVLDFTMRKWIYW